MNTLKPNAPPSTALDTINAHLIEVTSEAELTIWLRARKDVIEQDLSSIEAEHRRSVEKREGTIKFAHSMVAIPVGLALLWHNSPFYPGSITPGLALLGGAFYSLALNFLRSFTKDK
jgi:hypothetical protein